MDKITPEEHPAEESPSAPEIFPQIELVFKKGGKVNLLFHPDCFPEERCSNKIDS